MELELGVEIQARGPSCHGGVNPFRVLAATEVIAPRLAEQDDAVTFGEGDSASVFDALQGAEHADYGGWVDRAAVGLVVEGHVAAGNRGLEDRARVRQTPDYFGELPHDLRLLRVAKVEAVRDRQRLASCAHDVAGGLCDREPGALVGIQIAEPAWPVDGDRNGHVAAGETN